MQTARRLIMTTTGIPYAGTREPVAQKRPKLKLVPAVKLGPPLLTAAEVAKHLGVDADWVRQQRALPFRIVLSERRVRYSPTGLKQWLKEQSGAQR